MLENEQENIGSDITSVCVISQMFYHNLFLAQDLDSVTVQIIDGQVEIKEKLAEYVNRGDSLESWSYLDFFLGTYDGKTLKERSSARGRPGNTRVPYKPNTQPEGRCRVLRSSGHDTMPYFPAFWLAKKQEDGNGGLYEASILALLKPWRSITDLKEESHSFKMAFDLFLTTTSDDNRRTVENMDFFHESSKNKSDNLASSDDNSSHIPQTIITTDNRTTADVGNPSSIDDIYCSVTEDVITRTIDRPFSLRELKYADDAIGIGNAIGAFAVDNVATSPAQMPLPATAEQCIQFRDWESALANIGKEVEQPVEDHNDINTQAYHSCKDHDDEPSVIIDTPPPVDDQVFKYSLNEHQAMAFNIIIHHLDQHLRGNKPPQRLLIIHGQGGTGKSTLLNAISQAFHERGVSHLLAKTATSGVAATMIGGQTLHTWAALPIAIPTTDKWVQHPSKEIDRRRKKNIGNALWLMIDEMSMLTTPTLELLSRIGSVVRASVGVDERSCGVTFGNLNVILLSDFHQFPPVASSKKELYCDDSEEHFPKLGRSLYKQFDTVIKLAQQIRIQDPVWNGILHRSRTGDCTVSDIAEIRKLVLGNPDCILPDFTKPPWDDAVLVTPRNGVSSFWNERALEQHCQKTGNTLFTFYAQDNCNEHKLTPRQHLSVAHMN